MSLLGSTHLVIYTKMYYHALSLSSIYTTFLSNTLSCLSTLFHSLISYSFFFLHNIFLSSLESQKKKIKKMSTIFFLPIFLSLIFLPSTNANYWPLSPGYYPSTRFKSMSFYQGFRNLWGPNHQSVDNNGINIWLDRTSGLIFFNFT